MPDRGQLGVIVAILAIISAFCFGAYGCTKGLEHLSRLDKERAARVQAHREGRCAERCETEGVFWSRDMRAIVCQCSDGRQFLLEQE